MEYIKIEQSSSSSSNIDNTRIKTAFEQAVIYFGKTSAGKNFAFFDIERLICLFFFV